MTPQIGSAITGKIIQRINGPGSGVNANLVALTQGALRTLRILDPAQVRSGNFASDMAERSDTVQYPAANVYCEKIVNSQIEKFRTFSGKLQMAIDLRHSEDRLDHVQSNLETYTDAVMAVLDSSLGDWGGGMYYAGGYQVAFGPVKHGGKNFIQIAKITFEIGVSTN
jgi:hypothetical protein